MAQRDIYGRPIQNINVLDPRSQVGFDPTGTSTRMRAITGALGGRGNTVLPRSGPVVSGGAGGNNWNDMEALRNEWKDQLVGTADRVMADPRYQTALDILEGVASGQNLPMGEDVQGAMLGRIADSNAAGEAARNQMLRRQVAAMGGSVNDPSFAAERAANMSQRQLANSGAQRDVMIEAAMRNHQAQQQGARDLVSARTTQYGVSNPLRQQYADGLTLFHSTAGETGSYAMPPRLAPLPQSGPVTGPTTQGAAQRPQAAVTAATGQRPQGNVGNDLLSWIKQNPGWSENPTPQPVQSSQQARPVYGPPSPQQIQDMQRDNQRNYFDFLDNRGDQGMGSGWVGRQPQPMGVAKRQAPQANTQSTQGIKRVPVTGRNGLVNQMSKRGY